MELAYLGLFTKVFNWVMDKIMDPVFKFVSDLLSTVFTWIFNEILAPVLFPILEDVLEFAIELYSTIYSVHLYSLFSAVLKLVDYLEIAFDVFIGRSKVTYTPPGGSAVTGTLLEVLIHHETVSAVFWALTLGGFGIAMLLTVFGVAKSAFDLDFENKRPVSKVLTAMMKCFIQFFMVPLFVYFMLIIAVDILNITIDAISGSAPTTLGRIVWVIASLNAARTDEYNANSINYNGVTLGTSEKDILRYPFYTTQSYYHDGHLVDVLDYVNMKAVNASFNLADFDYLIGFLAAIFLLFVMAVCIITFVQRIFEVILLYIVSPYFVSTMPLDDGERFGRWRDLFIGKCFTGYGSAIGMRLYLSVCTMIMGGEIKFSAVGNSTSIEIDYFMKLFFLLGGAWAVFKSGPMVTSLLSSAAGQQEGMTQAAVGGVLYGHTIGTVMAKGKGAMISAFRGKGGAGALARDKKAKNADPNQKFAGSKGDRMAKASQSTKSKANAWKKGVVSPNAKRRASMSDFSSMKSAATAVRARRASFSGGEKITTPLKPLELKAAKVTPALSTGRLAMRNDPTHLAAAKAAAIAGPLEVKTTASFAESKAAPDTAYKEKKNFRLGSALQSTYDANGNHKIRVLGFGVDRDSSGNTMAFKMPVAGLKVQRTDPDQSMKLAKMHIPGIAKVNSNVQNGQLKYSDVSVLHGTYNYHHDEKGSKHRVLGGMMGVANGKDGAAVSVLGGAVKYQSDINGNHVTVGAVKINQAHDGVRTSVDMGDLHVRTSDHHGSVSYGNSISFKTSHGNVKSMKVGALEYSRSGIMKATSEPEKPESGTKPGGK